MRWIGEAELAGDVTKTEVDGDIWRRVAAQSHATQDGRTVLDEGQTSLLVMHEVRGVVLHNKQVSDRN